MARQRGLLPPNAAVDGPSTMIKADSLGNIGKEEARAHFRKASKREAVAIFQEPSTVNLTKYCEPFHLSCATAFGVAP